MTVSEPESIIITEEEAKERLDKILRDRFEGKYSRTYFQSLIESELVLLNGQPVKKREKPKAGDEVEVEFSYTPEISLEPEAIPLFPVFEDEHLLILNKPAGMVVHPAPGNWSGTLVNALLYYCKEIQRDDTLRPGIVHRLDKETSGLIITAKTREAQQKMVSLFAERAIQKVYLAITLGRPPDGEINSPIGRHPKDRKLMAIVPEGRKAVSFCKTLTSNGLLSLMEVEIFTGRTHQIRVHLKSLNAPVLGDKLYGKESANKTYKAERQMLHAAKLCFTHPFTGKLISLICKPPEDFERILRNQKISQE